MIKRRWGTASVWNEEQNCSRAGISSGVFNPFVLVICTKRSWLPVRNVCFIPPNWESAYESHWCRFKTTLLTSIYEQRRSGENWARATETPQIFNVFSKDIFYSIISSFLSRIWSIKLFVYSFYERQNLFEIVKCRLGWTVAVRWPPSQKLGMIFFFAYNLWHILTVNVISIYVINHKNDAIFFIMYHKTGQSEKIIRYLHLFINILICIYVILALCAQSCM